LLRERSRGAHEPPAADGRWFRSYGNEHWEFGGQQDPLSPAAPALYAQRAARMQPLVVACKKRVADQRSTSEAATAASRLVVEAPVRFGRRLRRRFGIGDEHDGGGRMGRVPQDRNSQAR
jgi:hypothetical protein